MKYLAALLLSCMIALPVFGQQSDDDPCDGAETQMDLNACAKQRYDAADKALNTVYAELMEMIGGEFEDKVRQAQRTWIKYRDAHCESCRAMYDGGSMAPMVQLDCLRRLTGQRTEELRSFIEQMDM